jgi:uracil-DNA glycosylase
VPEGITPPPSLLNVFKELETDLGLTPPAHGNLQAWATQGVLMLNSVLTVRANAPTSHQNIGWQRFTDAVIRKVSDAKEGIVFLLWGNYARTKKGLVNTAKHYVLEAAHPSPLARGAFFGCRHFSITNELLTQQGKSSINWGKQEQKQE